MKNEEVNSYIDTIERLKKENMDLKSRPRGRFGYLFIVFGLILFSLSIDFDSYMLSFFSVTFVFIGGLFLFIAPSTFIRLEALTSVLAETSSFYRELSKALELDGNPVYKSAETLNEISEIYAYIPRKDVLIDYDNEPLWSKTETLNEDRLRIKPIGLGLHKLMERESKTNFASIDLELLFNIIENMLVENLELVKNINIIKNEEMIDIKIRYINTAINDAYKENEKESFKEYIISGIVCSIAKSTHKPVLVKNIVSEKDNLDEISLRIFG
jgi:hypothetical protein